VNLFDTDTASNITQLSDNVRFKSYLAVECVENIITQLRPLEYFQNLGSEKQKQLQINISNEYIDVIIENMLSVVFDSAVESGDEAVVISLSRSNNLRDFVEKLSVIVASNPEYLEQIINTVVKIYTTQCNRLGLQFEPIIMNQLTVL
jgi:hypothetical protein